MDNDKNLISTKPIKTGKSNFLCNASSSDTKHVPFTIELSLIPVIFKSQIHVYSSARKSLAYL